MGHLVVVEGLCHRHPSYSTRLRLGMTMITVDCCVVDSSAAAIGDIWLRVPLSHQLASSAADTCRVRSVPASTHPTRSLTAPFQSLLCCNRDDGATIHCFLSTLPLSDAITLFPPWPEEPSTWVWEPLLRGYWGPRPPTSTPGVASVEFVIPWPEESYNG